MSESDKETVLTWEQEEAAQRGAEAAVARNDDIDAMPFEAAITELQSIVETLEKGKMSLEDSVAAFERGTLLRLHCERKLAEAELRVETIVKRADGSWTTRPPTFKVPRPN